MSIKYPNQVCSVVHQSKTQSQTLGVDCFLSVPNNKDYESGVSNPLEIHGKYSRFKFTLINKKSSGEKMFATYNISADDIPKLYEDTKFYNNMYLSKKVKKVSAPVQNESQGEKIPAAYSVRISMGIFKGRTPAEILSENPDNKTKLEETMRFLSNNMDKYPANKSQVEAIKQGLDLLNKGLLQKTKVADNREAQTYQKFEMYSGIKIPNRGNLDENGNTMVYTINISYNPEMGYPINISITNCAAPPTANPNDPVGVQMDRAVNKKTISMFISMEEWFKTISKMDTIKNLFEHRYSDMCFMKWEEEKESSNNERRG